MNIFWIFFLFNIFFFLPNLPDSIFFCFFLLFLFNLRIVIYLSNHSFYSRFMLLMVMMKVLMAGTMVWSRVRVCLVSLWWLVDLVEKKRMA